MAALSHFSQSLTDWFGFSELICRAKFFCYALLVMTVNVICVMLLLVFQQKAMLLLLSF